MSYGLKRSLVLGIFMFGVVQLGLGHIGLMKENQTQEQYVATLLGTQKGQGVSSFIIPQTSPFERRVMLNSLRMLNMVGVLDLGAFSLKRNMLLFLQLQLKMIRQLCLTLFGMQIQKIQILLTYLLLKLKNPLLFMRRNTNNLNWKCH